MALPAGFQFSEKPARPQTIITTSYIIHLPDIISIITPEENAGISYVVRMDHSNRIIWHYSLDTRRIYAS